MCVRVYVCVHVCVFTCVRACMCMCMFVCVHITTNRLCHEKHFEIFLKIYEMLNFHRLVPMKRDSWTIHVLINNETHMKIQ